MSKKKEPPKKTILLGRVGTNLKVGIVGLPNVGYVKYVAITGIGSHRSSIY